MSLVHLQPGPMWCDKPAQLDSRPLRPESLAQRPVVLCILTLEMAKWVSSTWFWVVQWPSLRGASSSNGYGQAKDMAVVTEVSFSVLCCVLRLPLFFSFREMYFITTHIFTESLEPGKLPMKLDMFSVSCVTKLGAVSHLPGKIISLMLLSRTPTEHLLFIH